jgi:transcription elongation factor Elf1
MHADPTEEGHVEWYDIVFEHGIECKVPVSSVEVTLSESHTHSKKKMKEAADMVKCPECGEEYEKGEDHECEDEDDMKEGMDAVNKKALKKDFDDREDQDIDNDGDEDDSDRYIHMRRKAISKALSKKK